MPLLSRVWRGQSRRVEGTAQSSEDRVSRPDLRTNTTIAQAHRSDGFGLNMDEPNIGHALESLARSQPTAPALHVPGRTSLNYADLGAQISYVRKRLGSWGVVPGDVIAG